MAPDGGGVGGGVGHCGGDVEHLEEEEEEEGEEEEMSNTWRRRRRGGRVRYRMVWINHHLISRDLQEPMHTGDHQVHLVIRIHSVPQILVCPSGLKRSKHNWYLSVLPELLDPHQL